MSIKINNLNLRIDESLELLNLKVSKKLKINKKDIKNLKILKESIDARRKDNIKFNYCVEIECEDENKILKKIKDKDTTLEKPIDEKTFKFGDKKFIHRPIIIGMGPAGLFAGLIMAQNGYNPIIIERGEDVEKRTESVKNFWKTGVLNPESNVQFGEGGAGAFSDGKLTTRIKDNRCDFVLREFVKNGAPKEIIYKGKPHVGTDILKDVVKNIREEIKELGGEVRFNSKLQDIKLQDKKLKSIVVNGEEIPCEVLILAIGHSSRDTYSMLYEKDIMMESKPFAIGVRTEHLQQMIDENQYGKYASHPRLKAAEYRLTHTSEKTGRGVYSFCMCPGGVVVGASSEEGRLVVNGMSYHARDGVNANSAIVVTVSKEDFGCDPLSGMNFQRHYEEIAYNVGGKTHSAPVQLLGDFLNDRKTTKIGSINPSVTTGYNFSMINNCLPSYIVDSLKEGFVAFDRKIKGFAEDDVVLTGIETRTSAPLRILRDETLQSVSIRGLYPCGEGAGFAGGIVSAAVDGLKVAENIMKVYNPFH